MCFGSEFESMKEFDLILFAGQSNMAGRGCADMAPVCPTEAGWEYRAVTSPNRLCSIKEPFGLKENNPKGVDDGDRKKGGMVSAFVCEYHRLTGRAVIGVSASQGGTSSELWKNILIHDAANRMKQAHEFLSTQGMRPSHSFLVWCQGETDGDHAVSAEIYRKNFLEIWNYFRSAGCEQCGLIQIGHFNSAVFPQGVGGIPGKAIDRQYEAIRTEQERMTKELSDIFLAASFAPCEHEMCDPFHYRQSAYNSVGMEAAYNAAISIDRKDSV